MSNTKFKYFRDVEQDAVFTKTRCQYCGADENCLEGEYFDRGGSVVSVCLDCLTKGIITVNIPDNIKQRISNHTQNGDTENSEDFYDSKKLVNELSKTPPVPWIQYNDWPVCCNDFGRFIGEWGKSVIIKNAKDKSAKDFFLSILDDFSKQKIDDYDSFWDDIGNGSAIFVFECLRCSKITAVCQSY